MNMPENGLGAMLPNDILLPAIVMLAGILLCAAGLVALLAVRRHYRRMRSRVMHMEQIANAAAMDVKSLIRNRDDMAQALARAQTQLSQMRERQGQMELARSGPHLYEQAIELVRQGFDSKQLMQTCGLSRGEAELVSNLHRAEHA